MLAQARRMKILELLQEEGTARVSDLSGLFKVSEPTIRQDLDRLQEEELVVREHGGAYLRSLPQQVGAQTLQRTENMEKKAAIGKRAAQLIEDGDSRNICPEKSDLYRLHREQARRYIHLL